MHPGQPADTGTEPGCPDLTTRRRAELAHSKVPTLSEQVSQHPGKPYCPADGAALRPHCAAHGELSGHFEQPGKALLGKEALPDCGSVPSLGQGLVEPSFSFLHESGSLALPTPGCGGKSSSPGMKDRRELGQ